MANFTGGTIEIVYPHHNPNEGRDIWNRNFQYVEDSINFSITGSTSGHTIVESGNSNIIITDSGITIPTIYQVSTSDDVIFTSISAQTINLTSTSPFSSLAQVIMNPINDAASEDGSALLVGWLC